MQDALEIVLHHLEQQTRYAATERALRLAAEREVEALRSQGPVPNARNVIEMIGHIAGGRKIEAIKEYRNITGMPLVEAKRVIETITNQFGVALTA